MPQRQNEDDAAPQCADLYSRRVLLCVTGLSPQVVTETLYGLAKQEPPFVPTEVHLATTRLGAEHARLSLLSDDPGWFHRLCKDLDLPLIAFPVENIHVLESGSGEPLDDIRSPDDNVRAANFLTDLVRRLTSDPAAALHVSIAGGRKTMGFYVGYALSLFGRGQDRLSHVLVQAPFESHPQFYYPTPHERVIHTLDKQQLALDCSKARVWLADIPFVRLRHGLPETLLHGDVSYSEAVLAAQDSVGPPELVLDLSSRQIRAGRTTVTIPPGPLAMLAVFARRAQRGAAPLPAPAKNVGDLEWAGRYLAEYRVIRGEHAESSSTERALMRGMDGDHFSIQLSRLHAVLRKDLGTAAGPYLISGGRRRPRRYRLELPATAIRFAPLPPIA